MRYTAALLPAAVILALAAAAPAFSQSSSGGGSRTMGGGGSQIGPGADGMVPMPRRSTPGAGAPAQPGPSDTDQTATEALTGTGRMGPEGRIPMTSPGAATRDGTVTGRDFPTSLDQPVPGQSTLGTPAPRRHPTENLAEGRLTEQGMVPDTRPTAPGRLPQGPAQRGTTDPADRRTGWIGQQPGGGPERSPVLGGPDPNVDQPLNPELRNRNPDDMMR